MTVSKGPLYEYAIENNKDGLEELLEEHPELIPCKKWIDLHVTPSWLFDGQYANGTSFTEEERKHLIETRMCKWNLD